jgi:hypothetical protein
LVHKPTLMHDYRKNLKWGHNPPVASNWSRPKLLKKY